MPLNEITSQLRKGFAVPYIDIKGNEKRIIRALQFETTNYYGIFKDGNFARLGILGYNATKHLGECICNGYDL